MLAVLLSVTALHAAKGFAAKEATSASKKPTIVHLNRANMSQLKQLKGIGKKRAAAIIKYRQKHGHYKSWRALANVPGLTLNFIKRLLHVNPKRVDLK